MIEVAKHFNAQRITHTSGGGRPEKLASTPNVRETGGSVADKATYSPNGGIDDLESLNRTQNLFNNSTRLSPEVKGGYKLESRFYGGAGNTLTDFNN